MNAELNVTVKKFSTVNYRERLSIKERAFLVMNTLKLKNDQEQYIIMKLREVDAKSIFSENL